LAAPSHELEFVVALPQRNIQELESIYWDRTNPKSDNWRNWMTSDEILAIIAPEKSVHDSVLAWFKANKVSSIESHGDAIRGKAPIVILSRMFNVPFYQFQHTSGARIVRAFGEITVPQALSSSVVLVEGLANFPIQRNPKIRPIDKTHPRSLERGLWDWDSYNVPATAWNIYNIPNTIRVTNPNSSQGVIEWEGQSFNPTDLKSFGSRMGVPALDMPTPSHVVGPNNANSAGDESTLDIEWISATGLGATNWFWLNGGENSWLYSWSTKFFSTANVPLVNSISYGWAEQDQCVQGIGGAECAKLKVNSDGYVARVNIELMKIGLRGVTLVVASGDSGVNGRTDEMCSERHFNPDFPAASPYVTSVGATQLRDVSFSLTNPPPICNSDLWFCASSGTEQAVSYDFAGFASGGGFSNVAPRPSYQTAAVAGYFQTSQGKLVPKSYFNQTGRGYPDIAAIGSAILIILGGSDQAIGGTSASSPIVAGVFTLLNDYALNTDKKPLGPMNPLLYQWGASNPDAFTDVTVGDNACTESGCALGYCIGFSCAKGWDPVTGFGTPNYQKMVALLADLIASKN
jgi:tripeptidyl-peptidase-1